MKKVLFIGMTPNQGGLETFMMNVFINLEGNGFHFEFLNPYSEDLAYSDFIIRNNGTVRKIKINRSHIGYFSRFYSAKKFFLRHNDYDIVHLNTLSLNNLYWLKAASKFNIPKLIIHSHDYNFKHNSKIVNFISKILTKYNHVYLNNTDIIELAVSYNAGKWMFNNNLFKIIKNGIDTKLYQPNNNLRLRLRKKLGIKDNDKVLITVSRLTYQKNYFKILNIFYLIYKKMLSAKLVIVGEGEEKNELINWVKKYNIENNVIFLGNINNVEDILNISDIMIMPSRYEGFPFALVECQANGVPALVSSEAIPKEANITGQLSYMSLSDSNNKWAYKAIEMLNNMNDLDKKNQMNQKVKDSEYDIDSLTNQIRNVYLK